MLEVVVIGSSTLLGKRMTLFAAITLGLSHRQCSPSISMVGWPRGEAAQMIISELHL